MPLSPDPPHVTNLWKLNEKMRNYWAIQAHTTTEKKPCTNTISFSYVLKEINGS